jgi:serine/threonine protein kinase
MNFATETVVTGDTTTPPQQPLSPEEIAPHFPQLEILECLGRGGMGVVYKARQKALNRLVAVKLLAPEREKDAHFAERFAREAQALAAMSHPHIVTIHDFGQANGFFYLLMEFVDGVNLRQLLQSRKLTPRRHSPSCRRSARPCSSRTSAASCIATSSLRTCCSTKPGA